LSVFFYFLLSHANIFVPTSETKSGSMLKKMKMQTILLFASVLCTGLIAGLFYSYSCSVMGGLARLSNENFLAAFQSIDKAIQNPLFLSNFLGMALLLPITTIVVHRSGSFSWMLLATIIYFVGILAVTIGGNIPLNEKVAQFPLSTASAESIAKMREAFENRWNNFHTIRTIASIASFSSVIIAIINHKR